MSGAPLECGLTSPKSDTSIDSIDSIVNSQHSVEISENGENSGNIENSQNKILPHDSDGVPKIIEVESLEITAEVSYQQTRRSRTDAEDLREYTGSTVWWSLPSTNWILLPSLLFFTAYEAEGPAKTIYLLDFVTMQNPGNTPEEVQAEAAIWDLELRMTQSLISFFAMAFLSGLSDHKGRKFVFIIHGSLFVIAKLLWVYMTYHRFELHYLFIPQVVSGLSGDWPLNLIISFAYSADTSNQKNKQINFGRVEAFGWGGAIGGPFFGGLLYENVGHWVPWAFSASLYFLTTVIYILLPESLLENKRSHRLKMRNINPIGVVSILLETRHRILLMVVLILGYSSRGTSYVLGFFMIYTFKWKASQLGTYASVLNAYRVIVCLFFIPFTKRFKPKWHSMFNMQASIVGFSVGILLLIFAPSVMWAYLFSLSLSLGAITVLCMREIMSNAVEPHRQAMALSAIGLLEGFINIGLSPLYEGIWASTVGIFPGAAFLTGCIISTLAFAVTFLIKEEKLQAKNKSVVSTTSAPGQEQNSTDDEKTGETITLQACKL